MVNANENKHQHSTFPALVAVHRWLLIYKWLFCFLPKQKQYLLFGLLTQDTLLTQLHTSIPVKETAHSLREGDKESTISSVEA